MCVCPLVCMCALRMLYLPSLEENMSSLGGCELTNVSAGNQTPGLL